MVTKYTTGQAILIPATIVSAEERDDQIIYHVDAETWEGVPEAAVIVDERAEAQRAMRTFMDSLMDRNDMRR